MLLIAKGARGKTFSSSTLKIAQSLGISQQSVSRNLRELKRKGLIELETSPRGINARPSKQGLGILKADYIELKNVFEPKKALSLQGILTKGLGEGSYYMSLSPYVKQFEQKLGFKPFAGTLNLIIDEAELFAFLSGLEGTKISGFKTKDRTFGSIKAFRVKVGAETAAIIFPERSTHPPDQIEVIAGSNLREKLRLKEGSKVVLKA